MCRCVDRWTFVCCFMLPNAFSVLLYYHVMTDNTIMQLFSTITGSKNGKKIFLNSITTYKASYSLFQTGSATVVSHCINFFSLLASQSCVAKTIFVRK